MEIDNESPSNLPLEGSRFTLDIDNHPSIDSPNVNVLMGVQVSYLNLCFNIIMDVYLTKRYVISGT